MKKCNTNSPEETKDLAAQIAKKFKGGEVLSLVGELGAGKTVFVQGVAEALGVTEVVNSPTFVLMKIYSIHDTRFTIRDLVHVDAYRLSGSQELKDIGLEEYLNKKNTVVIIEWADKVKELLSKDSMIIEFNLGKNENQRIINFH